MHTQFVKRFSRKMFTLRFQWMWPICVSCYLPYIYRCFVQIEIELHLILLFPLNSKSVPKYKYIQMQLMCVYYLQILPLEQKQQISHWKSIVANDQKHWKTFTQCKLVTNVMVLSYLQSTEIPIIIDVVYIFIYIAYMCLLTFLKHWEYHIQGMLHIV